MKHGNSRSPAQTALTAIETQTAEGTPVWVVWWEEPDRSWESLCLTPAESETEYAARQADHLIQHWGKVGKREEQSLLAWLENHLRVVAPSCADNFVIPAKEILCRAAAGESGPVIVRTW